ncbi:MAG: hypothetical protein R3F14_12545 [Polyangiaceae bacterium]
MYSDAEVDGEEVGEVDQEDPDTGLFCLHDGGRDHPGACRAGLRICFRQQARTLGVSYKYCVAGVCPSCHKLGKDLGCASIQ